MNIFSHALPAHDTPHDKAHDTAKGDAHDAPHDAAHDTDSHDTGFIPL